jgi:bisphosphoglycerate-independent phosphoglycerate mutase (AlkP superfamily)
VTRTLGSSPGASPPCPRLPKPVVLCILDGWGIGPTEADNAPLLARTPNFDRILAHGPHATLTTHGRDVGLPDGQMGNSEVGHTNIGAGRIVAMDLGQIDLAIEDGELLRERRNPALHRHPEGAVALHTCSASCPTAVCTGISTMRWPPRR